VLGNVMPLMGRDWSHSGVTQLLSRIKNNGYKVMYLTSRAIGQVNPDRTVDVRQDACVFCGVVVILIRNMYSCVDIL